MKTVATIVIALAASVTCRGQLTAPYDPIAPWSKMAADSCVVVKCTGELKDNKLIYRVAEVWKNTLSDTDFKTYLGSGYVPMTLTYRGYGDGQNILVFYGPVSKTACGTFALPELQFIGEQGKDALVLDVAHRAEQTYTFARLRALIMPKAQPAASVQRSGSAISIPASAAQPSSTPP